MARYIHRVNRKLPKDIRDIVFSHHTSNGALKLLKKHRIAPILSKEKFNKLIKSQSQKHGVLIKITKEHFKGKHRVSEGLATRPKEKGKLVSRVLLHPIAQYYPSGHTKELISHEIDHVRALEKRNHYTRF